MHKANLITKEFGKKLEKPNIWLMWIFPRTKSITLCTLDIQWNSLFFALLEFWGIEKISNKQIFYFSVIKKAKFYEDDTLIYDIQSDCIYNIVFNWTPTSRVEANITGKLEKVEEWVVKIP